MATLNLAADGTSLETIDTMDGLREIIGRPSAGPIKKDIGRIDEHFAGFIAKSPFLMLATSGANGTCDVSPRGDGQGFVRVLDERHIAIPDRPGNRRADSLSNIIETGKAGLIFLIPGIDDTLRMNGAAAITQDPELLASMAVDGKAPKLAIIVTVEEAYLHCQKAFRRSTLWNPEAYVERSEVESAGCMYRDQMGLADVSAEQIDANLEEGYKTTLW